MYAVCLIFFLPSTLAIYFLFLLPTQPSGLCYFGNNVSFSFVLMQCITSLYLRWITFHVGFLDPKKIKTSCKLHVNLLDIDL